MNNNSLVGRVFDGFNSIFMVFLCIATLYPFWYVLMVSLNDNSVAPFQTVVLLPKGLTLYNYVAVLMDDLIISGYAITVLRSFIGMASSVLFNAMAAYCLMPHTLPGRKFFLTLITITLFFGGGLIPWYLVLRALGLINTFMVYIIPSLLSAWTIIIMKTYFLSNIPYSLEESAYMDGANELYIFFKIVLPLSGPMLATMCLFSLVFHWNDWWFGEILVSSRHLKPVQTVLRNVIARQSAVESMQRAGFRGMSGTGSMSIESIKMAAIIVVSAPVLAAYPFFQRYLIKGIMIGSIKG